MTGRAVMYLVFSGICALVALWVYRTQIDQPRVAATAAGEVATVPVVVASDDLPSGVAIDAGGLTVVQWPEGLAPKGTFDSIGELADRVAARPIGEGEPVLEPALLPKGERGGLQALIEPNHRAVSVEVDAVVGVGGFIKPGSRVDVLAQLKAFGSSAERRTTPHSRTILQNVKVLAIDQEFGRAEDSEAALASVVTLQVTPEEAQKLAYAAAEGRLHLALRGHSDEAVVSLGSTVPSDFLDAKPSVPKRNASRPAIQSIRGTKVGRDYL